MQFQNSSLDPSKAHSFFTIPTQLRPISTHSTAAMAHASGRPSHIEHWRRGRHLASLAPRLPQISHNHCFRGPLRKADGCWRWLWRPSYGTPAALSLLPPLPPLSPVIHVAPPPHPIPTMPLLPPPPFRPAAAASLFVPSCRSYCPSVPSCSSWRCLSSVTPLPPATASSVVRSALTPDRSTMNSRA